ncbi:hypothetical protein BJY00DRAFT_285840 [Aspergillus carlsbadensis]|nr:hypothetical protein BJY00DRAFT_285840 [Aspergillus carlsbadensis]
MEMRMQRFFPGPDGLFAESSLPSTEHVFFDFKYTGHNIVALDPFRHLVAIPSGLRGTPVISELVSGDFESVFLPDDPTDTRGIDALCRGAMNKLTQPPKYAHHKARRPLIPKHKYHARDMWFVDGNRLLYRTSHSGGNPDAYYIFDFRLRVGQRLQ